MSIGAEAIQNQTDSDIEAERIERNWRRSGETAPKRPMSQDLSRRLIEGTLDLAGHVPGVDDRAQAALGRLGERLAIGAEMDHAMRQWLVTEIKLAERDLRDAYQFNPERRSA